MMRLYYSLKQKWRAFQQLARLACWRDAVRFTWARLLGLPEVEVRLKAPPCTVTLRPRNSDFDVLLQTFVSGGCDVREKVASPRRIIDGGANIGLTAIQFAAHFPGAEIIAIEPEPANYALLVRNTAAFPNIRPLHAAIWPRPALLSVAPAEHDSRSWSFQTHEKAAGELVQGACQAVPIDELVSLSSPADLVKLDIEGAEWPLLEETDLAWLRCAGLLVVELHGPQKDQRLQRALAGLQAHVEIQHEKHLIQIQSP